MRKIRYNRISEIKLLVDELNRLRMKHGYTKISEHKRQKLRKRIRWYLGVLRHRLPRMKGIYAATDPNTWDIYYPSEGERRRSMIVLNSLMAMGKNYY